MNYINIPYSDEKLCINSIVILGRFPDTKWILKNGWYLYENVQYNGWYFCSIPANTILPVEETDLINLTVISVGEHIHHHPTYDTCFPPPIHDAHRSVEIYLKGVKYTKGQLLWLNPGEIYQVKQNFRSTSKYEEVIDNFNEDIESGKLVSITEDVTSLLSKNLMINFKEVFGTDEPTKADADTYLATLIPPVTPNEGISFINIDELSETYLHIYSYYTTISDGQLSELIFIDTSENLTNLKSDVSALKKDVGDISTILTAVVEVNE